MVVALCAVALSALPAHAHAAASHDDIELLDEALDALEDGDDERYDELVALGVSLPNVYPRLVIEALLDRDSALIDDVAEMMSLDNDEIIDRVIESINDEQAAIKSTRDAPPTPDGRSGLRDIDMTNEAYLFLLQQRGLHITPAVERVLTLLPPPGAGNPPLPNEYARALLDLGEPGEEPPGRPTPPKPQSGLNLFIPFGISLIALAMGVFALWRARRNLQIASTDGLTGLQNRRRFDLDIGDRERRGMQSTAMLMIDVDNFKAFNDTHGHRCGDDVLRRVGDAISGQVRENDVTYRYGGEEFCVLLPDADREVALTIAERVRHAIAGIQLPVDASVTASVGVAVGPSAELTDTLNNADIAMYAAKAAGRNQVAAG